MKYYVRKDASSDLEGPFDLEAIRGWVAGGRFTTEFEAIEDLGRTTDQLKRSRRWQTLEELFAEPASTNPEQSPKAFLEKVREQSCYKTLRLCVDLVVLAAWIAAALGLFFYSPAVESNLGLLAMGLGILVLAAIVVVAFRQSAFVLIDVADILIEQNRKKQAD
jgi:hypothetical protein